MWDTFFIESTEGTPLGEPEDVLARLKHAFPELTYELKMKEHPLHVPPRTLQYLIEWIRTRGGMGYPQYGGYFGCIGVFQFLAKSPVLRIEAGFINRTEPSQDYGNQLEQLFAENDWMRTPANTGGGVLNQKEHVYASVRL